MKNTRYFVAGHKGLVGSAIMRALRNKVDEINIITSNREEVDLINQQQTQKFFEANRPDIVIGCAAKVGGIHANNTLQADFIRDNLLIQNNLLHFSHIYGVDKFIFLGSSCVYPKNNPIPIKEERLLSAELEITNEAYAIAKIAGIKMAASYNRQYGTDFRNLMPCNLYGINDNYDPLNSHVVPALIRKFHLAKQNNSDIVELWGTGKPKREFLFANDLADAVLHILQMDKFVYQKTCSNRFDLLNVGSGKEISIEKLASLIALLTGFKGSIKYNNEFPDGTLTKLICSDRLFNSGWSPKVDIVDGLKISYKDYLAKNRH